MDIIIKDLNHNNLNQFVDFLIKVYNYDISLKKHYLQFYNWKYILNKELYPDSASSILALTNDNEVIGSIGAINYRLRTNNIEQTAVWIADWIVDDKLAPKGLGTKLLETLINNENNIPVTCTELSSVAELIFDKKGYKKIHVGFVANYYLSFKSINSLHLKKKIRVSLLKISNFIKNINFQKKDNIVFIKSNFEEILFYDRNHEGNIRDDHFMKWLLAVDLSEIFIFKIENNNKRNIGFIVTSIFRKDDLKFVRILDYSIEDIYFSQFLIFLKKYFKNNDIIEIKISKNQQNSAQEEGYYTSSSYFWHQSNIRELNPNKFIPSFSDKDSAYRGVKQIK